MNFLYRRKSFIIVQEYSKLENTKNILSSKFEFLVKQIRFTSEAITRNELLVLDFKNNYLFTLDLQSKIASSLQHLSSSSCIEWSYLKSLKVKDIRPYLIGELKEPAFLLDTDLICKESDEFFFTLAKLGIIDLKFWTYLSKLRYYSECVGVNCLNDSSYYSYKNVNIIEPIPEFKELEKLEDEFFRFLGKPLIFKTLHPVLCNFLKITDELKNSNKIFSISNWKNPQYESIRTNQNLMRIPPKQRTALIESLSQLNSFPKLYQAAMEIYILGQENPSLIPMFKYFLQFFLCQKGYLFDVNNPEYEKLSFYEKITRATMWIDFVIFLSEHSIDVMEMSFDKEVIRRNFSASCDIELSVLLEKESMDKMFLFNMYSTSFLVEKTNRLKTIPFYQRNYSTYVNKYLASTLY